MVMKEVNSKGNKTEMLRDVLKHSHGKSVEKLSVPTRQSFDSIIMQSDEKQMFGSKYTPATLF